MTKWKLSKEETIKLCDKVVEEWEITNQDLLKNFAITPPFIGFCLGP